MCRNGNSKYNYQRKDFTDKLNIMKIQIVKNFMELQVGMEIEKPDALAEKLIAKGFAIAVGAGKKVIDDLNTKELKVKGKAKK